MWKSLPHPFHWRTSVFLAPNLAEIERKLRSAEGAFHAAVAPFRVDWTSKIRGPQQRVRIAVLVSFANLS